MDQSDDDFFAPMGRGLQHATLRAGNRRAVLTSLGTHPGSSNADLSRLTGLAPQTASAIVSELETEGLIVRGDVLRGRRGQPATPLSLNPEGAFSIGVEIGWRHLDALLLGLQRNIVDRYHRWHRYPDSSSIVGEVARIIDGFLAKLPQEQRGRVTGVALATPTSLGRYINLLGAPPEQGERWGEIDLRFEIERATGLPTTWHNNGNAACWAELVALPQPRPSEMIYLFAGSFVVSGVVADHVLFEGRHGNAGNLGAMRVGDGNGERRAAHRVASLYGLTQRLRTAGIEAPPGDPLAWPWDQWEPQVDAWVETAASAFAELIYNTAAVIELDCVVLDGWMPRPILKRIVELARPMIGELPGSRRDPLVLREGRFAGGAPAIGAALLTLHRRFFSRDLPHMVA